MATERDKLIFQPGRKIGRCAGVGVGVGDLENGQAVGSELTGHRDSGRSWQLEQPRSEIVFKEVSQLFADVVKI